jgi:ribosome biogenesis GTPase
MESNQIEGRVLDVSRRYVTLWCAQGAVTGTVSSKALEVSPGDLVRAEVRDGKVFVISTLPASRCIHRSYRGIVKRMGSNIDLMCIITAVGPALNPSVIDRMLVAAKVEKIPVLLVVNKADLGLDGLEPFIEVYRDIGVEVITCSAKHSPSLGELEQRLQQRDVRVAALCGVSGVGKSTILNRLVPGAQTRTADVSVRTGQGKQTTTQPRGFLYESPSTEAKVIIDFPGVQLFGLSHLKPEIITASFEEFVEFGQGCRFTDCRHLQEPECAVRDAVEDERIAPWRYNSYIQILQEIEDAREY